MTLKEFRGDFDLRQNEQASSIRYFFKNNIDFEVYLPTKGFSLQRDFVWTLEQQRELIHSIFIGRHIPHCAIVNIVNPENKMEEIWQIIDGKQRLMTMLRFSQDKFTFIIGDKEYYYSELPKEFKLTFDNFYFRYYIEIDAWDKPMTDEQKISWFKFINFAGTPQDKEHLEKLK